MLKQLLIFFSFSLSHVFHAQVTVYQDVFRGGVKCTGFSTGTSGIGSEIMDFSIPNNSTLEKIYLLTYSLGNPTTSNISINNNLIKLNDLNHVSNLNFQLFNLPIKLYLCDVTSKVDINNLQNTLITLNNNCIDFQQECGFFVAHFFVLDKNMNDSIINFNLPLANKSMFNYQTYQIDYLNPINTSYDVGFSLYLDRSLENINDGSTVKINGINLGYIYGEDIQNTNYYLSGVQGNFTYRNTVLSGLFDDIPDFQMSHHDALSDIKSIVANNISNFILEINHFYPNSPGWANFHLAFPLAYTTPCQPQNVSVSSDTTICPNEPLQLFATGGVSYEWLPAAGLSCNTCANPVFVGDSSQLFTVRIWGNDSCSVVRPVMVHVRQQPTIASLVTSATTCGLNQGTVQGTLADSVAVQFSLDNGPLQDTSFFSNLAAGSHTLSLHDAFGCSFDTLVNIAADTTVSALFTATPSSGAAPLQVALTNQSTNATNYVWQLAGVTQANPFNSFTATDTGTVQVQLIAYQNNPSCADTAWASIFVYDSVIVSVPNVFSPNNDNTNEFFGITSNTPLTISGALVNRWGQTMVAWENQVTVTGFSQLWNGISAGAPVSEGVYFYRISWHTATQKGKLEGNVSLVK